MDRLQQSIPRKLLKKKKGGKRCTPHLTFAGRKGEGGEPSATGARGHRKRTGIKKELSVLFIRWRGKGIHSFCLKFQGGGRALPTILRKGGRGKNVGLCVLAGVEGGVCGEGGGGGVRASRLSSIVPEKKKKRPKLYLFN